MKTNTPPGSDKAVSIGCKCPRMDNAYGRGYMGQDGVFVISGECPVHTPPSDTDKLTIEEFLQIII